MANIEVTLSAPGYVTKTITAGRWWTFDSNLKDVMSVMKPNNPSSVISSGNTSGNLTGIWNANYKCNISIPGVSVVKNNWVLGNGGTYEITLSNVDNVNSLKQDPDNSPLIMLRLNFQNDKGVDYVPESFEPSVGTVEHYMGDKNQFIWRISPNPSSLCNSAKLILKAPADHDIVITGLLAADARNIKFY